MKKLQKYSLFLILPLLLTSCTSDYGIRDEIIYGSSKDGKSTRAKILTGEYTPKCEEFLDMIIAGEFRDFFAHYGLELIDYELLESNSKGKIVIIENLLNSDELCPVFTREGNDPNQYYLCPISEITDYTLVPALPLAQEKVQNILSDMNPKSLSLVNLYWKYNDFLFTSVCVVSKDSNEIIYDNILSNMDVYYSWSETTIVEETIPLIKTRSENSYVAKYTKQDSKSIGILNPNAYASYTMNVTGVAVAGGIKILQHEASTTFHADRGYSAQAGVTVTSFEQGTSGHCYFQAAVMVGRTSGLSLGWNGISYTLPGGSEGRTYQKYVLPYDLK